MTKGTFTLFGLALALVLFFAVNIVSGTMFQSIRVDLTEENLYTLSDGAKNIARDLEEPITLQLYFSATVAKDIPELNDYGRRVRELLEEFERSSDGNIQLEVIDPEPFSEEEDRAVQEGLYNPTLPSGDSFFLGLVGTDSVSSKETIIFFEPSKERFLEYDISQLVYKLSNPEKATVAVMSHLPIEGAQGNPMMGQQGTPPWQILAQLRAYFDVRVLEPGVEEIDDDVDVLVVIHPRGFSDATLYAIDQFVLRGGKLLAFVDPHCESDQTDVDPSNPYASMGASKASNMEKLFRTWGFEMVMSKVVGDRTNALRMRTRSSQPGGLEVMDHVQYLQGDADGIDREDAVTSLLQTLLFGNAGSLRALPGATTTFTPLVQTSEDSMLIDVGKIQFMPDPQELLTSFVSLKTRLALAARITGDAVSAFPDGKPGAATPEDGDAGGAEDAGGHLTASVSPINVIAVADVDMLEDRFWIQEQRLGNLSLGWRKTADNGDLAINAVENFAGGDQLISIRARGKFSRPFDRVEDIRRDAEQRYLDEQRMLEAKLQAAQEKINQIQSEKSPDSQMILTPAQAEALDEARAEQVATKKKLRDVRHNLRKDIERLGTQIKLLNILAVPLLMLFLAISVWVLRSRRHA